MPLLYIDYDTRHEIMRREDKILTGRKEEKVIENIGYKGRNRAMEGQQAGGREEKDVSGPTVLIKH